jgi:sugar/nucleoside kinase (ribokinase family)
MAAIVAVGSMAFDSIETPFGKAEKILGGSVNYFSLSAGLFAPIRCVSVVGEDFPKDHLELFKQRGIDITGIKQGAGMTFHWAGKYGFDLNTAQTLDTKLNVFEVFEPNLPESYRDSEFVFLGNLAPHLQMKVLEQVRKPRFIALDTMNFWIEGQRSKLIEVLSKCHAVIINEGEVRQLTETYNIVEAAQKIRTWGPQILVIKRGEYGSVLFDHGEVFSLPALPLAVVKDPTGAGDSFAGGFMGYLASQAKFSVSRSVLRRAVVYGSVMASFTVQDFGVRDLLKCTRALIEERYHRFVELTSFHLD